MSSYPATLSCSVASALLGSFQFGYHLGVLNTCLDWLASDLDFAVASYGAIVVSAVLVGATIGSLLAGETADKLGPRRALVLNNITLAVGSLLCATTPGGIWGVIAGRFLAGLGAGAASLYVPRYLSEISPISIRGGISTLNQVFICTGILVAFLVGLPYSNNQAVYLHLAGHHIAWWRVMLAIGILPAVTQMASLAVLPESPMWLKWKGHADEALAAQKRLLGSKWQDEGEVQEAESLLEGAADTDQGAEGASSWGELLDRRYRWIMLLVAGLPLLQQMSGINTCMLYSTEVFKQAGLQSPALGTIIMGAINLFGTLVAASLMDKAGRRLLLLLSHAGMGLSLLLISVVAFIPGTENIQGTVSFVALLAFVLFFGLGSGPIPWVYLPEVLPDRIKGRAASLGTSLNWLSNMIVGLTFPLMLNVLHVGGSYLVYALFNFVAVAFTVAYVVETKQRSLNQIQEQLLMSRGRSRG